MRGRALLPAVPQGPEPGGPGGADATRPHLRCSAAAAGRDPLSAPERDVNNPRPPQRIGQAAAGGHSRSGVLAGRAAHESCPEDADPVSPDWVSSLVTSQAVGDKARATLVRGAGWGGEAAPPLSIDTEVGISPVRRPHRNLRRFSVQPNWLREARTGLSRGVRGRAQVSHWPKGSSF